MQMTEEGIQKPTDIFVKLAPIKTASDLKCALWGASTSSAALTNQPNIYAPISIFDRNNRIFALLAGLSAPLLGSGFSALAIITIVWAFISLALRRFDFEVSRDEKIVAYICVAFAAVHILISAGHSGLSDLGKWLTPMLFLGPLLLAARLRLSNRAILWDLFVIGSAIGVILAAIMGAFQFGFYAVRAEGLLGNSGVFALIGCVSGGIGGLNLRSHSKQRILLGAMSLLAMTTLVIFSQMRAMFPAAAIVVLLVVFTANFQLSKQQKFTSLAILFGAALIITAAISNSTISYRFKLIENDITAIFADSNYDSSIGQRLAMWQASYFAIQEHPYMGYGMADRMAPVQNYLKENFSNLPRAYSHPHNAGLTALLDAGIPGLLSLIFMTFGAVFLAIKRRASPLTIAYFAIITISYCFSGLTGIMFHHDITDAFFVVATAIGMHHFSEPS